MFLALKKITGETFRSKRNIKDLLQNISIQLERYQRMETVADAGEETFILKIKISKYEQPLAIKPIKLTLTKIKY